GAPQTVEAAVTLRAVVRPQGSGDQKVVLVNAMSQQDVTVVLSAEEISAAGWASGAPAGNDTRIPIKGNRIVMQDRTRNVEAASGIYIGGQLVRIEVQARG
nr:hypothetical protein [Hyphomonas sp.]